MIRIQDARKRIRWAPRGSSRGWELRLDKRPLQKLLGRIHPAGERIGFVFKPTKFGAWNFNLAPIYDSRNEEREVRAAFREEVIRRAEAADLTGK